MFNLIATCKLGLESVLKEELLQLGCQELSAENGEISFKGDDRMLALCNVHLRTAERVFLELSCFPALTFDELFEGISEIYWDEIIPKDGKIVVVDKCLNSQLLSGRSVQSITKKAIVEALKQKHKTEWLPEDGAEFKVHVNIIRDQASVLLDASGVGLHKRGYRAHAGEAPLRETMAAAMILLSQWKPGLPLFDPMCGAGTIPIEAALIGADIAPGLYRSFAAEDWPFLEKNVFEKVREEAKARIKKDDFLIHGSDLDEAMIKTAAENAKKANVDSWISFEQKSVKDFKSEEERGIIIVNPPYGERLEDVKTAEILYETMGEVFPEKKGWEYFILSPHPEFESLFGRQSRKNRKIYNGKIKCYFYTFK